MAIYFDTGKVLAELEHWEELKKKYRIKEEVK